MFSTSTRSVLPVAGLVTLLTVALTPSASRAQAIYFHNDTSLTLNIHASSVFRGVVMQPTPVRLLPKKDSPPLKLLGNKMIIIQDARFPGRDLFRGTIQASDDDLYFVIQPSRPVPRVGLRQVPPPRPEQ